MPHSLEDTSTVTYLVKPLVREELKKWEQEVSRSSSNISLELGTAVGVGTVVVVASDGDND